MAYHIRLSNIILNDRWPGVPNPNLGIPTGGFDATTWNFPTKSAAQVASPPYPIGTKIMAYTDNTNCPGWYTMMYLMAHDFSSQDCSVGTVCTGYAWHAQVSQVGCGTKTVFASADTTYAPWYVVSRCTTGSSDPTKGALTCLPCCSVVADSSVVLVTDDPRAVGYGDAYGWFWVGGVCPCKDLTFLDKLAGGYGGADPSAVVSTYKGPAVICVSADCGQIVTCGDYTLIADSSYSNLTSNVACYLCASVG